MSQTLAIVGNTWKQSQRQVVFIITGCLALLVVIGLFLGSGTREEPGGEVYFHTALDGDSERNALTFWYEDAVRDAEMNSVRAEIMEAREKSPDASQEDQAKVFQKLLERPANQASASMSPFRKSAEYMVYFIVFGVSLIAPLGFIAASSGYFPDTVATGAVDVLVAKPLGRTKLFFAKFLGGMALYAALICAIYLITFALAGLLWGVWMPRVFLGLPLMLMSGALLFAFVAFFGLLSRGVVLPMALGFVFYVVLDSILGKLGQAQMMGALKNSPTFDSIVSGARHFLPNFQLLNDVSRHSMLTAAASLNWQPFITAGCWLVAMLTLGWWKFRRTDY